MVCKKCGGIAGWDPYFQSWICTRCGNEEPKPMTNANRIRSMNDEELAKFIAPLASCPDCYARRVNIEDCGYDCKKAWLNWLEEATENAGDEPDTATC